MPITHDLIGRIIVGDNSPASIEFTSIPSNYDDLIIKGSLRTTRAGNVSDDINILINSSSSTFSRRSFFGNGSTGTGNVDSVGRLTNAANAASATSSTFSNIEVYFLNYTNSRNKSFFYSGVAENNATTGFNSSVIGHWATGNAITSVRFESANSANFVQHSTLYLYGIRKA